MSHHSCHAAELQIATRTKRLGEARPALPVRLCAARLQLLLDRRDVPTAESGARRYVRARLRDRVGAAAWTRVQAPSGAPDASRPSLPGDRMRTSNLLVLAGVSLALAACNKADPNRTTSVPAG